MNRILVFFATLTVMVSCGTKAVKEISETELRDRIAGAWLGQMVGNIYGLEYENDFVDQPGEGPFTWEKGMRKMTEVDGAFSDDDTDVEYMYLTLMEKYGVVPTYEQIREGWMYHIRDRVWLANRATLGLMHYGLTPPFTGDKDVNPHWFQIDPQLINEVWAFTAPGMPEYAAGISDWAARITSDSWAVSPTVVYGVMYANAFFESDMRKLVEGSIAYLPEGDRYKDIVRECLALYDQYPDDWKAARAVIADKYWHNEDTFSKTIWNAALNGAMGILSMLYGDGDIAKTLNIGCALGFDCDNQTATVCGILGTMYGLKSIPMDYAMPAEFPHWKKPFNDRYINVTRHDLPDASIEDIIDRTVVVAEKIILANGGKVEVRDGEKWYIINTAAKYNYPLEFCVGPMPRIVAGEPVDYEFYAETTRNYDWKLVKGDLPEGLTFNAGRLTGTTDKPGHYAITLSLSDGKKTIEKDFDIVVRGRNISRNCAEILSLSKKSRLDIIDSCWTTNSMAYYAEDVAVINDGVLNGPHSVFATVTEKSNAPKSDWFGYRWDSPVKTNMVAFHYGCLEEYGGWYSNMHVEYLDAAGKWQPIDAVVTPALPESDVVFIQPHFAEFVFEFEPVETTAIRVIGDNCRFIHYNKYTRNVAAFVSVSEVQVYESL
ncbi:MAG: ADP-ribosylglycohydrolase family protein [Bacteroidales bacterium]|nr:ADP-ribosylglycohydrolase family protein [Bacteroidales bacterium]